MLNLNAHRALRARTDTAHEINLSFDGAGTTPSSIRSPWSDLVFDRSGWGMRSALVIAAATLIRLLVALTSGLSDTEAYYYSWSRFPQWSYYDHPPMIAWLTHLTTFASHTGFAVRIGPVIYAAVFAALVYRLAARLFTPRAAFIAVVTVVAMPMFLFIGFVLNPESALAPLWILYLLQLDDLRRHREWWRPLLMGVVMGLAFLCKYTGLLLLPVTLGVVATSPDARGWLRRPTFYLAGLVALAIVSPVIVWNQVHHWPSVTLHLVERVGPGTAASFVKNALHALSGQLVLFHPLIFPGLLATVVYTVRRARTDLRFRLLAWASAPVLLFFFVVMARVRDAEPHWTMVAYIPLAIAAGAWLDQTMNRATRAVTWYLRACLAVSAAVAVIYFVHSQTPVLLRLVPEGLYNANTDTMNETLGWDRVREAIAAQAAHAGEHAVVVSDQNVLCGHILTETDDRPEVYCESPRRTEFDFIGRRTPPPDAPVIFVDNARYPGDPAVLLPGRHCDAPQVIEIVRGGRWLNRYRVMTCRPDDVRTAAAPQPLRSTVSQIQ